MTWIFFFYTRIKQYLYPDRESREEINLGCMFHKGSAQLILRRAIPRQHLYVYVGVLREFFPSVYFIVCVHICICVDAHVYFHEMHVQSLVLWDLP